MHGDLDNASTYIGRFENLQDEFLRLMAECSVEEIDTIREQLENGKRLNQSSHSHYSQYYDDELRALV